MNTRMKSHPFRFHTLMDAPSEWCRKTYAWWSSIKSHDWITKTGFLFYAVLLVLIGQAAQVYMRFPVPYYLMFYLLGGGCFFLAFNSKKLSKASAKQIGVETPWSAVGEIPQSRHPRRR